MKNKSKIDIEQVYDLVPYFVVDDAGFPRRFVDLDLRHRTFLEDFFHYTCENLCDCDKLKEFIQDLHGIRSDLEGVLNEFED
tara:strand:+ start:372 stop:617 length:246 start_codon:yes stop_codon:yes gene_type:complete